MRIVMAAVVCREGRILICQRRPGRRLAGVWEFPGGKLEEGETPEQGLVRELQEEMELPVQVGRILDAVPEREFHEFLILYYAAAMTGPQPVLKEHSDCRFVLPQEMVEYEFSTADQVVARKIARGEICLESSDAHFDR